MPHSLFLTLNIRQELLSSFCYQSVFRISNCAIIAQLLQVIPPTERADAPAPVRRTEFSRCSSGETFAGSATMASRKRLQRSRTHSKTWIVRKNPLRRFVSTDFITQQVSSSGEILGLPVLSIFANADQVEIA